MKAMKIDVNFKDGARWVRYKPLARIKKEDPKGGG